MLAMATMRCNFRRRVGHANRKLCVFEEYPYQRIPTKKDEVTFGGGDADASGTKRTVTIKIKIKAKNGGARFLRAIMWCNCKLTTTRAQIRWGLTAGCNCNGHSETPTEPVHPATRSAIVIRTGMV